MQAEQMYQQQPRQSSQDSIDTIKKMLTYRPHLYQNADPVENAVSKWEMDPSDIFDRFEHKLRGEKKDPKGNWTAVDIPRMNPQGINWLLGYLEPFVNKNTYLSEFKEAEIYQNVRGYVQTICAHLWLNNYRYQLDLGDYVPIIDDAEALILAAFLRAKDGAEKVYRQTIMKLIEQRTERDYQKQKQGFFSKMRSMPLFSTDRGGDSENG